MRVVVRHHVTDNTHALVEASIGSVATVEHGVDDATVDGLQPISDVWQCTPNDYGHCIVQVGPLHLVLKIDRVNSPVRLLPIRVGGYNSVINTDLFEGVLGGICYRVGNL